MYAALTLALAALATPTAPAPATSPDAIIARWVRGSDMDRPRINVWLDRDDVYNRGEPARVYFKSDRDAYVTIVRIDTDGRMRVLFPIDPFEDNFARGGKTFEVLGRDRDQAFRVDDYPGVGYVFAIASVDAFKYDDIVRGDHWDYRTISDGRVRGDPYVAVSDMADRIASEGEYDYDVTQYYVERHYDYPRFVCYDCHSYASWPYWDPYSSYCSRFRIVIYDDWYYYPYRRYSGPGVIIRPYRPGPRYVFKDADPRNDFVTRVAERPRGEPDRRPVIDRDRTSADVGGRGVIPAPVPTSPRRRPSDNPNRPAPSTEPRRRPTSGQPSVDGRPVPSDAQPEPRRRPDSDHPKDPGTVRDQPPPGQTEPPRRRPVENPQLEQVPDRGNRDRAPRTSEPSRREPVRQDPQTHEPRRDSPRLPDPGRSAPREPSHQAPPPRSEPRSSPPPRSTGEPQLRRRPG
jgi:hypothetical protein